MPEKEVIGALAHQTTEPQLRGLFIEADLDAAVHDERSVIDARGDVPRILVTPTTNNSELNPAYFGDSAAYFINWREIVDGESAQKVALALGGLASGTKVVFEHRSDEYIERPLLGLIDMTGRQYELDPSVIDETNQTMASVAHFVSNAPRGISYPDDETGDSMRTVYRKLVEKGVWPEIAGENIYYTNGLDVTPELLEKFWEVYDKTFDNLVSNHPSAQKQPKEDFLKQASQPYCHTVYAYDNQGICSAIFLIDDVSKCNWLNSGYYNTQHPDGSTVFVPGISTKLDKQGLSYSPKTIGAISEIAARVPNLVAFATQCTNRSAEYIPRIAEFATVGSVNLSLEKMAEYMYPVYKLK